MKLVVNQAYENMGLASTQLMGPILDGLMRNTPDAQRWIETAARGGRARGDRRARRPVRRLQPGAAGAQARSFPRHRAVRGGEEDLRVLLGVDETAELGKKQKSAHSLTRVRGTTR